MTVTIHSDASPSLAESISRSVQSRTGGQIRNLTVEITGPDVTISGHATTYYLKQLATQGALDLAGQFRTLTNAIEVAWRYEA